LIDLLGLRKERGGADAVTGLVKAVRQSCALRHALIPLAAAVREFDGSPRGDDGFLTRPMVRKEFAQLL